MKTILDRRILSETIDRINSLTPQSRGQWGKMNVAQMLKHCTLSEEVFLGKKKYERLFIGFLFGKMILKGILKNNEPMKKNQPTHPEFKIKGAVDFEMEKQKWITLLKEYSIKSGESFQNFRHPFFGKMTQEQIGYYVFKHTDHHLRQFNH